MKLPFAVKREEAGQWDLFLEFLEEVSICRISVCINVCEKS